MLHIFEKNKKKSQFILVPNSQTPLMINVFACQNWEIYVIGAQFLARDIYFVVFVEFFYFYNNLLILYDNNNNIFEINTVPIIDLFAQVFLNDSSLHVLNF